MIFIAIYRYYSDRNDWREATQRKDPWRVIVRWFGGRGGAT